MAALHKRSKTDYIYLTAQNVVPKHRFNAEAALPVVMKFEYLRLNRIMYHGAYSGVSAATPCMYTFCNRKFQEQIRKSEFDNIFCYIIQNGHFIVS